MQWKVGKKGIGAGQLSQSIFLVVGVKGLVCF